MSSILIATVPIHGHVTPLLGVAEQFVKRGDQVRFLTGAVFAERVAAVGATHLPLPAEADFDVQALVEAMPDRQHAKGVKALAYDVEHVFVRPGRAQYDAIRAANAEQPADVVLCDPAFFGTAHLLGHPRPERPPVVICGVLPLSVESVDTAPYGMGLTPASVLNRLRNRALTTLSHRILRRGQALADQHYRDIHGAGLPYFFLDGQRRAEAVVQFSVPSFEYPRSDAPPGLSFVGPLSATGSQAPRPDWWDELDGSRPVVHVTQGTVANEDYSQTIAPTLRALADQDVLVVVTTGGRELESLPPLPANARAARYLPYDELLPRTSVFVTNGGYGGVQYALRYGVPIVATGGKEDKPEVGARVLWSGVGRRIRSEQPSERALRSAILAVLNEPRYRQASARVAAEMAASPGFDGLAQVVDGLVNSRAGQPNSTCC